jgi:heterodisulfide reductase subunit C
MKTFLDEVNERIDGVPIQRCYHCRKCTAGCPMAFVMEYNPNKVIKMIQMGRKDQVLGSSTIWLCASCETCITRCPNEVDIARMMDVLRQMALESGKAVKEKRVLAFHEAFLSSIKSGGRLNEPMMMVNYKIKSGGSFLRHGPGPGHVHEGKALGLRPQDEGRSFRPEDFRKDENGVKRA